MTFRPLRDGGGMGLWDYAKLPPQPTPVPESSHTSPSQNPATDSLASEAWAILVVLEQKHPVAQTQDEIGDLTTPPLSRATVSRYLLRVLRPRGLTAPIGRAGEAITDQGLALVRERK